MADETPGFEPGETPDLGLMPALEKAGLVLVRREDLRLVLEHVTPGASTPESRAAFVRLSDAAGEPADPSPVSLDGAGTPEGTQPREDAIRYDERRRVLDAARPITVLMKRTDGSQVAAVQWSRLLQALGLKP